MKSRATAERPARPTRRVCTLVVCGAMLGIVACGDDDSPTSPDSSTIAGSYRLDIRASSDCGNDLGEGRQQAFDATIAQRGSDLQITLSSRRDLPTQGGFEGRVTGPGSMSASGGVTVTSADDPNDYEADGNIGATVGPTRIEGELNGTIRFGEAMCEANDHRVEFRRD